MTFSSSSFYIVLPSNTEVEGNRTNSFRVHLPRKLQFNSQWAVGLAVLVYPHSWPSLGTTDAQWILVEWQSGEQLRVEIPTANVRNPEELLEQLKRALGEGSESLAGEIRNLHEAYERIRIQAESEAAVDAERSVKEALARLRGGLQAAPDEDDANKTTSASESTDDKISEQESSSAASFDVDAHRRKAFLRALKNRIAAAVQQSLDVRQRALLKAHQAEGLKSWQSVYTRTWHTCKFTFDLLRQRFHNVLDKRYIKRISLSGQLAYILGYEQPILEQSVCSLFCKAGDISFYLPGECGSLRG